jgi:hypothetical protein
MGDPKHRVVRRRVSVVPADCPAPECRPRTARRPATAEFVQRRESCAMTFLGCVALAGVIPIPGLAEPRDVPGV